MKTIYKIYGLLLMPVILMSYLRIFVIPSLNRNPEKKDWIPVFTGMTQHQIFIMQHSIIKNMGCVPILTILILSLFLTFLTSCSSVHNKVTPTESKISGKPTAPVTISYTVPAKIAAGESINITVQVNILSDAEALKLRLIAGEGLDMTPKDREVNYSALPMNSTISESVTVTPQAEGILYLHVFVSGVFNGRTMARSGAVPVNAGQGTGRKMLRDAGQVTTDSKGQNIIIMPLEERGQP